MGDVQKLYPLGSYERPLRVAVIGSGPSGFYAAEALLASGQLEVQVDMFDRLPTPYGLVRGGVAPDHQKIKSVIQVYEKIAAKPGFRFFGNMRFGKDIFVEDIGRYYDQVIYAVGNETDKRLGIPGEDLDGNHSATSFVGWYNGHPDYRDKKFDLSQERVAVVGIGNVCMDVTRILAHDPEKLSKTDIAEHALEALRASKVKEIILLGRRGVAQAAFSPAEITEIGELESADLTVLPEETKLDPISEASLKEPNAKKNVAFLQELAKRTDGSKPKKIRLRFLVSPVEILGHDRVEAIKIEKNKLAEDGRGGIRAQGTGQYETLPVGLVLRSVGYHGVALPGVPFDKKIGHIPHVNGRVIDLETGNPVEGAYVVGWAKRGPSGLIGTNRADSVATVKSMLEDVHGKTAPISQEKTQEFSLAFIKSRQSQCVSFEDWKILDRLEIERGAKKGKVREKFSNIAEMLSLLQESKKEKI